MTRVFTNNIKYNISLAYETAMDIEFFFVKWKRFSIESFVKQFEIWCVRNGCIAKSDRAEYQVIEHNTYWWWMWMLCSDICKVFMFPTAFNKPDWMSANDRIFASSRRSIRQVFRSVLDSHDSILFIKYFAKNSICFELWKIVCVVAYNADRLQVRLFKTKFKDETAVRLWPIYIK